MITFKQFTEAVADIQQIKRKKLIDRTPREQAALNAAKASKPPSGKVEVHLKHEDGTISKSRFKLMKSQDKWDAESKEIADNHLKNKQSMHDQFPNISRSRAKEIHKVVVK
jgi:hypothetical protein